MISLIIDAHVHIGGKPEMARPDNLVALLEKSEIDKAIVFRYVPQKPMLVGNTYIKSAVNRHPKRLIGFAWINPNDRTAVDEMKTAIVNWNFRGVKLHLEMMPSSISRIEEIFREAEKLAVPICIHLGEDFDFLNDLCRKYRLNVIVAHLGTGVYNLDPKRLGKAIELSQKNDNVYLESSGNTFFFIERALKMLDPTKIIFGSDFPHEHPLVMLRAIKLLDLPPREKEMILGRNIAKLINES
jgi:predicted TIM-barrel fold metal-dependent hydrolase